MTEEVMKKITWHLMNATRIQLILKRDIGLSSEIKSKLKKELNYHIFMSTT